MEDQIQLSEADREQMAYYDRLAEQRLHQRKAFTAEVTIASETNFYMGFSENISEGGLFLSTLSPPEVGEQVSLSVKVEDNEITVEGVVRWHRTDGGGQITGCGVEFVSLDRQAHIAFSQLIRQLRKEPLFFEL